MDLLPASRNGVPGIARLAAMGISALMLAVGGGAALDASLARADVTPALTADALNAESPAALAQVVPAGVTPDLGTHGTLMLTPDPAAAPQVPATTGAAQPAIGQPIVPCGVGLIAFSSAGLGRTAFARGSITCFGVGVTATIRPTVDWFNTPLFIPFRHSVKPIMNRTFGRPYIVTDQTNKGVPRRRVVRMCVLITGQGYLPAFGCFYAPFGPLNLPLDGGGV